MSGPVFLHVDMDAFYASVEQQDNPSLKGKPVIVGALPGRRGVVSACSYEARKFGIHSAMPASQAHRLCPHGVFLPVRMGRYQEISSAIMSILSRYTPHLHQMSVDEAFLDLTGTERLLGQVIETARRIKQEVFEETKLTISVGVAPSRYLAKLASDYDKPDGMYLVSPGDERAFVAGLPLKALWGVGKKTLSDLSALRITTVAHLREYTEKDLAENFGSAAAAYLYSACRGESPGLYSDRAHSRSHSISGERTFESDVTGSTALERTLLEIAGSCMYRLMDEEARSRTVTLKLRLTDFTTFSVRTTLDHDIGTANELFEVAKKLLYRKWDRSIPVRLVGCGLGSVESGTPEAQLDLFDDRADRHRRAEAAVFALRKRGMKVGKARLLNRDKSD